MNRSIYKSSTAFGDFFERSVNTPGHFKRLKLGQRLPVNPYEWIRRDVKTPLTQTYNGLRSEVNSREFSGFVDGISNGFIGEGAKTVPKRSEASQICANRLLAKVRNSRIDLGVSLGEYRETASFIASAMKKTAGSYRQLRRGDVSGALRTLTGEKNNKWRDIPQVASDTWLAYSYGLRPLLKDVYAACELLQKGYQSPIEPIEVRSGYDVEVNASVVTNSYYTSAIRGNISSRGKVRFWVNNPLMKTLDEVGMVNPLSVAWELVPFSFVVDWFVPVGKFITNIVPPQGVSFVDGYISTKANGGAFNRTDISSPYPGWHTALSSIEVWKTRTKLSTFPRYSVVVPDISLEKSQIASAAALLWQVLAGEGRKSPSLRI